MVRFILLLLSSVACFGQAFTLRDFAFVGKAIPSSGTVVIPNLYARWMLEEGSGTSITNFISATTTNLEYGGSGTQWTNGWISSKMMYFDGADDYLRTTSTAYTNLCNFSSEDFTFSVWAYIMHVANNPVLFYKGYISLGGYYMFYSTADSTLKFRTIQGASYQETISSPITTNVFQHLAFVRSNSVAWIYVNGNDITSSHGTHVNPTPTTERFFIGIYGINFSSDFKGYLDEIRVYDRDLTLSEIGTLYNGGAGYFQ